MTNDLISRNTLMDEVYRSMDYNPHEDGKIKANHTREHMHFATLIYRAPAVEAEPVIHAYWQKVNDGDMYWYECSECGEENPRDKYGHDYFSLRCPKCGAHLYECINLT